MIIQPDRLRSGCGIVGASFLLFLMPAGEHLVIKVVIISADNDRSLMLQKGTQELFMLFRLRHLIAVAEADKKNTRWFKILTRRLTSSALDRFSMAIYLFLR